MLSKFLRIIIAVLVFFVLAVSVLGILYVVEVLTLTDLKDYSLKIGAVTLIAGLASTIVLAVLSLNKK